MNIPWKIKSAIFRIIEVTNATQSLSFFQKFVTRRAFIKVSKVNHAWLLHEEVLLKFDSTKYVLEVGAGQSLIQNLYLSKICDRQLVIDLFPILDLSAVSRAVKFLFSIGRLNSLEAVRVQADLRNYGLEYRAPCELKDLTLEIDKFDAIISTDTFEHIPFSELRLILDDLKKVLKPSGILSVCIDYSDHYSHTDKSISDLNFLKYSDYITRSVLLNLVKRTCENQN